jgi:hypothetical protein
MVATSDLINRLYSTVSEWEGMKIIGDVETCVDYRKTFQVRINGVLVRVTVDLVEA